MQSYKIHRFLSSSAIEPFPLTLPRPAAFGVSCSSRSPRPFRNLEIGSRKRALDIFRGPLPPQRRHRVEKCPARAGISISKGLSPEIDSIPCFPVVGDRRRDSCPCDLSSGASAPSGPAAPIYRNRLLFCRPESAGVLLRPALTLSGHPFSP